MGTRTGRSGARRRRGQRGLTLVEMLVAMTALMMTMAGYTLVVVGSTRATDAEREVTLATQSARSTIETMKATAFEQVFATYNANPVDDPGGAGTAPGASFAVPGLEPVAGDADGLPGEIVFPLGAGGAGLREDVVDARLGMPRDLNGDGAVDAADHAGDYTLLPVLVRVRWQGTSGPSNVEFETMMVDL